MISTALSRIQNALTGLPSNSIDIMDTVNEWFEILVYPDTFILADQSPVRAAIAVDGSYCTFIAENERKTLAKQFAQLMQANHYPEIETKLFHKAFTQLKDTQLNTFLRIRGKARDTGWTLSGVFPLENAMEYVANGEPKEKLVQWYAKMEANAAVKIGRSVGGNYSILNTELFGDTAGESLELYVNIAETLDVDWLPEPILDLIAADFPDFIEISYHITKTGISKLGLYLPNPTEKLVQNALFALGNDKSFEIVGSFEGGMGKTPDAIEFATTAQGFEAQLFYTPLD